MADKLLKSIKFPTLPDRYVIGDTSLTEEGAAADAKAVGEALATKADTKGTYEDLIVGGAEQLMADGYETDTEPYLFRTTGGSADVGNREYLDKIVGGTVAWNQLVATPSATQTIHGVTFTVNADSSVTVNGTATAQTEFTIGRVDYIANHKYAVLGIPSGASASTYWLRAIKGQRFSNAIDTIQINDYWTTSIFVANGATVSNVTFRPQVIDLTAMFGTTIADYIYSLEQSQAGAGVAWFRQYFTKDYYPYDAGTLKSVQTSAHKTYDADGNVIGTYPLDSSLTLRGIPKLVDGKLAFDGDVYPPSGEVQRRYGIVDLSTFNWTERPAWHGWRTSTSLSTAKKPSATQKANAISTNYKVEASATINTDTLYSIAIDTDGYLLVRMEDGKTASDIKGYLVYEKATPTTETAEGYEHYQICDPSGTEEFVTDSIVPVGHETRYPHDLKKKIETAPDSPSADGTYLMKRSGSKNAYMALPSTPSANGSYVLTVTVSGGSASYSWTAKE